MEGHECVNDMRQRFLKHPLVQSKVKTSPDIVIGCAELAAARGVQLGKYKSYLALSKKYPRAAKHLLSVFYMDSNGNYTLKP